jgi:hypothetical protein
MLKNILDKMSNWKFILPFFILFLIFPIFLFPYHQELMAKAAGEEIMPLDSRFSYSFNEVKTDFDKLGIEGRKVYRSAIGVVDMLFAVFYGPLFILVLAWLLKRLKGRNSNWILLSLFPLIGILFEYLENFNTLSLLDSYPAITESSVSWGEQMTRLKHIFLMLSVALMPILGIALLVKKFNRNQTPAVADRR